MTEASVAVPAHPITDRVREAMAVTLRHCEELLPEADWLSKLARAEATGTPFNRAAFEREAAKEAESKKKK